MTSTYSRDNLAALPTDDDDLTTAFASPADYNAVASNDGTTVDQSGTEGYAIFEWKETATGNSGTFTWKGKSTKAPSESKVQMQIYKRTGTGAPVWEDVSGASNNSEDADTNFTISGTVSDLTNYKADTTNEVALRTWQAASAASSWVFPANESSISSLITYGAAWNNVDLSTKVPSGTKLAILHVRNTSGSGYIALTRPNGATVDISGVGDATPGLGGNYHGYRLACLDSNLKFDGYFENSALTVSIVAYTSLGSFSTTPTNKLPGTAGSYQTIDCSANISANTWAVIETDVNNQWMALRPTGYTYDYYFNVSCCAMSLVKTDASTQFSAKFSALSNGLFNPLLFNLWGSLPSTAITMLGSPADVTPAGTSAWTDCNASLPAGATGVLVQVTSGAFSSSGIRKKGDTVDDTPSDIIIPNSVQIQAICAVDGSGLFQAYVANSGSKVYVLGYLS